MSVPVERRDLGDGWIISCHGKEGGGLTLTDVTIRRDNVVCQIMGGDTLFFPMFDEEAEESTTDGAVIPEQTHRDDEQCVLVHIRDLLLNAQQEGVWTRGIGGVSKVSWFTLARI